MKIVNKTATLYSLLASSLCFLVACATYHPVEATPESILKTVAPGDTVRIARWDGSELEMLVVSVTKLHIAGRTPGKRPEPVRVRLDQIDTIDVERPNLKKAMLTTLVPAVIAAIIVCNHQDCDTDAALIARFEP